jgi:hydrogenase nickel incorporation protein HypA/HybF
MHELSLLEGMIQDLQEEARNRGFARIHQIRLEEGTLAEGAELVILERPGTGLCRTCGAEVEVEARFDPCPACAQGFVDVTGGTELRIKDIDVD